MSCECGRAYPDNLQYNQQNYNQPYQYSQPQKSNNGTHFDLSNTIYFTIILVILWLMITAWDALIDRLLELWLGVDPKSIKALFLYALIFTLVSIIFLLILDEEFGYLFGINTGDGNTMPITAGR